MGSDTKIQWATHTFNPWRGCTKIAAGCANCYADSQSKRNPKTLGIWGPHGTRIVASEAMWREPIKWNKDVETITEVWRDERPRVFCASLADVFEDWPGVCVDSRGRYLYTGDGRCVWWDHHADDVPPCDLELVRARLFATIDATPNLNWLLLTKRPENIRRMWLGVTVERDESFDPPKDRAFITRRDNVWLGVSIACRADLRQLDELRACRDLCAKTFVSAEPLIEDLGEVDLTGVDWVIVGGESGPNARPCDIAWIRSIVRQCRDAGVPCFVKQLGANPTEYIVTAVGQDEYGNVDDNGRQEALRLRDRKGGDPDEWPKDIRVREVPS